MSAFIRAIQGKIFTRLRKKTRLSSRGCPPEKSTGPPIIVAEMRKGYPPTLCGGYASAPVLRSSATAEDGGFPPEADLPLA